MIELQDLQIRNPTNRQGLTQSDTYPQDFIDWWGGDDGDSAICGVLEGRFVVEFGVVPNEKQKEFIREKFTPAMKEFMYRAYAKNGPNNQNSDGSGIEFMNQYGASYFMQLLALADKVQLESIKKSRK